MNTASTLYCYKATVKECIDGDTADISLSLGCHIYVDMRVRLHGINTPELHSTKKKEREAAQKAKDRLKELVEGKEVIVKTHLDRTEKYGRLLAEIFIDEKSINQQMIDEKLAVSYDGGKR